jgi:hypothetical protein
VHLREEQEVPSFCARHVLQFQHRQWVRLVAGAIGSSCDAATRFEQGVGVTFREVSAGVMIQEMMKYCVRVLAEVWMVQVDHRFGGLAMGIEHCFV